MMISVLALGVLFFVSFYLVGSLFLRLSVRNGRSFLQHVVAFWVGLLLLVSLYAVFKATFITALILILLVIIFFRKTLVSFSDIKEISGFKFILCSAGVYVLVFFLQVNFDFDFLQNPFPYMSFIHPYDGERYIYSTIISTLHYTGVETMSAETVLKGTSGVSLYHFVEFWLGSMFKTVYNVKSDIVLFYFVFPLFKTFTILTFISIYADRIDNKVVLLFVLAVMLVFFVFGFLWVSPPMYKTHLRDHLFISIFILVAKALYEKKYTAALALLMIASVENVLFMPALIITLGLFFNKFEKPDYIKVVLFLILYSLFYYFFKENIHDKYFDVGIGVAVRGMFTWDKVNQVYWMFKYVARNYPVWYVVAYFFIKNYKPLLNKNLNIEVAWWIGISFSLYYFLYALFSKMSIDSWQIEYVAIVLAQISSLFLLYEFVKERKVIVSSIILFLILDLNYPLAKSYPFDKRETLGKYDLLLENKIARLSTNKYLLGLFIDENRLLPDVWASNYYPTLATDYARANDYRMYLFNYDLTNLKESISKLEPFAQPILDRQIQPLFRLDKGVLENIKQYDVTIVWISKKSKYLSAFKDKKVFHELEDYYVYYIDRPAKQLIKDYTNTCPGIAAL